MIENALLLQLKSLSPAQRLELIGAVWDLVDAEGLPRDDGATVRIDEPLAATLPAPRTIASAMPRPQPAPRPRP